MANIMRLGGGGAAGGGGELNVFVQETQPTAQNGLWVKKAKSAVTGVEIDTQLKAEDGNNVLLPGNWYTQGITSIGATSLLAGIKVGSIIYAYGNNAYTIQLKYDLETGIYSKGTAFSSSNHPSITGVYANTVYNGLLYVLWKRGGDNYVYIFAINPVDGTYYSTSQPKTSWSFSFTSMDIYDGAAYMLYQYINNNPGIYKQDITQVDTGVLTQVTAFTITSEHRSTNARGAIFKIDNILYAFQGCLFLGKYDLSTGIATTVNQVLQSNTTFWNNNPTHGFIQEGNLIYIIGVSTSGTSNNYYRADGVIVFDVSTNISTVHEHALTDEFTRAETVTQSCILDGTDSYCVGGRYNPGGVTASSSETATIIKYSLKSNDLPTGTVWAHESTFENVTEMYKDKTMTLNMGIDKVLIQEADGLKVQPAAIIKNGVATDIN